MKTIFNYFKGLVPAYIVTLIFASINWFQVGELGYGNDRFLVPLVVTIVAWTFVFSSIELALLVIMALEELGFLGLALVLGGSGYLIVRLTTYLFAPEVVKFNFTDEFYLDYIGFGATYMVIAVAISFKKISVLFEDEDDEKSKKK